jgi:phosphomannomutase
MADDIVQDTLLQATILALIAIGFLLIVVQSADLEQFYMRYYAKDTGMLIDASHALPGEAAFQYRSIHRNNRFLFNFTEEGVYLAPEQNLSKNIRWAVRKQYGRQEPNLLEPRFLVTPRLVDITKTDMIRFETRITDACEPLQIEKRRLRLVLTGTPVLVAQLEQLPLITELQTAVDAEHELTLVLSEGNPRITYGGPTSKGLACRYAHLLTAELGQQFVSEQADNNEQLTLRIPPLSEQRARTLALKLALPLDEVVV